MQYSILKTNVHATNYQDATQEIVNWGGRGESRIVCAANVHMIMEAFDSKDFCDALNSADMVVPDGIPLVWAIRSQGVPKQSRVYGPTLTLHVCKAATNFGIPVALYGGTEDSLSDFISFLTNNFPSLNVVCKIAPPFRDLTKAEDDAFTQKIIDSGARILFVGIGCPKQERWMFQHKSKISAVMLGVGAAFDFHSGRIKQAPAIIQQCGLEWLFRLCMEPKRLWKRYLKHNPRFIFYFFKQYLQYRIERARFK